jgi:hypothetical protein
MRDAQSGHLTTVFLPDAYFSFVLTLSEFKILPEKLQEADLSAFRQLQYEVVFTQSKLWLRCTPVFKRT